MYDIINSIIRSHNLIILYQYYIVMYEVLYIYIYIEFHIYIGAFHNNEHRKKIIKKRD